MARLTPVEPSAATGPAKDIFDGPLKGKHFNIFKAMASGPAALQGYLGLSGAVAHGSLSGAERELIQLAVGQANTCGYCVSAHTAIAKGLHFAEDRIIEARRGRSSDPKTHALLTFALAIHEKKGHVSDDDVAKFRAAGYNDGHISEVVANYALAIFTNYFNHVNDTPIDFPAAPAI